MTIKVFNSIIMLRCDKTKVAQKKKAQKKK